MLTKSIFYMETNSKLEIYDCLFEGTISTTKGAVFFLDYENITADIYSSKFIGNQAREGGVFFAFFGGNISFHLGCEFQENFAIKGGIGRALSDSSIKIEDSYIKNNYAIKGKQVLFIFLASIIDITISNILSEINNCKIMNNILLT